MSDQADLDELARRYLDLWQDQMTALAGDEEFAETLQQLTTAMGAAATAGSAAWAAAWPAMMAGLQPPGATQRESDGQGAADQTGKGAKGTAAGAPGRQGAAVETAAGATAAAGPPGGGGDVLEQLARRLAALEERIAALEGGARRAGRGAAGSARRRRS